MSSCAAWSSSKSKAHWIAHWLRGIDLNALAWLAKGDALLNNIYIFDESSASASHPEHGNLPWYVLLLIGSLSRKHIFPLKIPPWKEVRASCLETCDRLKWSWHFRNEPAQVHNVRLKLKRQVRQFSLDCPVEFEWCKAELLSKMKIHYDIDARK